MSYIYSGGSEVVNDSAGASSISGYMSGYLIAADDYETETPFARVFRAYGTDVKTENFVVESAGTAYFNNGTHTNLHVGPDGNIGVSNSLLTGLRVGGYYEAVSGAITSAVANLNKNTGDDVIVYSGAELNVSSGTLTNVTVSGNTNKWYTEWGMAKMNVRSKGIIDGGTLVNACRVMVSKGGVVSNVVAHTSTHLYALAGGLVSGCEVHCANLEVRNGTVRDTVVDSGGALLFTRAMSGQTFDVTIGSGGLARINSGGTMTRTLVSGGAGTAVVHVSSGAAVSTTLLSKGSMYVSKLAWYTPTVTGTILSSGAWMAVYGNASDTVVNGGARVDVYSSGIASGAVVNSGGKFCMQAGGSVNEVTVNENGWLFLHSGAATNIVENGGWAWGSGGGRTTLTFVSNAFSNVNIYSSATVHDVTTATNMKICSDGDLIGSCYVFGGIVHDVEISGGYLLINNSGSVSGAIVHSGGNFTVRGGADKSFVSGAMVERGGSMFMSNGTVQDVTVSGATVADDEDKTLSEFATMYMYNGVLDGLTVSGIAGCYGTSAHADVTKRIVAVISGGTANNVAIRDVGYVHVSGATVSNVTMSRATTTALSAWCYINNVHSTMNTRLQVYAGGSAVNVKTLGGTCEVFVQNGGKVYDIDLAPGAYFGVYAGGLIQGGSAVGKGAEMQGRGGMISGITLMSSGAMFVSTGTVRGNNFISGGYLRVGSKGANAVADSTFISGGYGAKIISAGKEKYTSGVCTAFVSSGGKLTNSLIGEGAWVIVRNSGTVSNTALLGSNTYDANTQDAMMMARIAVSGGAVWRGGDVLKHVQAIIYSGGSAEGITMGSGAHVYVSANATATDMVVDGALDFGLRGGTAENTLIRKGSMTVSTGVATGTIVRGGVLRLNAAAAVASDTIVSGGTISCTVSGGTFANTTVSSGGYLYGPFGTYNGVTVSSGGSMRVYGSGGTVVSDLTVEAGAKLTLDVNKVTSGGSLNIDSLANVNETVTVVNYATGNTYTLAEVGNENLKLSINYQGFYYEFGAGESYLSPIYDGRAFTLDAAGKNLTVATNNMSSTILTTEAADLATSGAFLTGFVNSADKAIMWADVQLGSAVTFATSAANIAGDAWIDLDRTKAAAGGIIYGAEGDCMSNSTIRYLVHGAGSVGNFAGGATNGGVVGGVELVGYNNTYDTTYLGGFGTVTGLVSARVSSGNTLAKDFYAGALANYAKTGAVTSVGGIDTTIALNMSAGTAKETKYYAKGNIYGASAVKAGTITTATTVHSVGDVTLTINNGEATKSDICIFAAGYATGNDTAKTLPVYTVESVTATIAGGNWGGAHGGRGIFGGAFAGDNTKADEDAGVWAKVGSVNLTISGGTMGNVYGGGWAQKGAKSEVGDVNITIKGGTIANVFGGGSTSTTGGSTVAGNVTITVSGGTITGDIYARGQSENDSVASAAVIFTGAKNFDCDVWGYSYVGVSDPTGATLSFNDYAGTFSGEIGGFNGITFDGNTTMTLGTAAADVANTAWTFDTAERFTALAKTAMLDWTAADFAGDTIAVNLADGNATEWDLVSAASTTSYNKFDVLVDGVSILGGVTIDLDQAIVGGDYAGWGFTVEEDVLKFKHLA